VKLRRLFDLVVAAQPDEREAILDRECGEDAALRRRIKAMVEAAEDDQFLGDPTEDSKTISAMTTIPPRENSGEIIDRYKLLEQIGEGGFGTVWMAEQSEPLKRRVALKIIKLGMDTKQVIARFEAERQALAMMDHPNIAKVFDAGATDTGRPYFVMEYIKGIPILEYCDTERLDTQTRLELFMQVCHAIQHAHHKGIIHRDVKPSNVLITLHDGVPVPKVIDFGIAKATNAELTARTLFTEHRQMIGTPAYMSPEQAEMSGLDIDTRADIYSLGVLLYELLTGTTPFDTKSLMEAGFAEMMRIIREEEPHKPSTRLSTLGESATRTAQQRHTDAARLGTLLRGELDWIVMKCLEKNRTRRYGTANALADDIRRHLSDEPVAAGPPSARYRLSKFVRRHRGGVLAATIVVAALVLGMVGTTTGMLWAIHEKDRAETAEQGMEHELTRATEVKRLITEMLGSINPIIAQGRDTPVLNGILDDTAQRLSDGEITDDLIAAELHHVIGVSYRDLGSWANAWEHIPVALEIRTRLLGEDNPATLQSAHEMISLHEQRRQFGKMEPLALRTLELRMSTLGPEHPDTLRSMAAKAAIYGATGRHAEAAAIIVQTLEIQRRVLGSEHRDTLESMNDLGRVYLNENRLADAEPILLETLEIQRRVLGEHHPDVLATMGNLRRLYEAQGRDEEAIELQTQVVAITAIVLGEQHSFTLRTMRNRGLFYSKMGRYDDACVAYEKELLTRRATKGMTHVGTWRTMRDLGDVYETLGRKEDALVLYRELLANLPTTPDGGDDLPYALFSVAWVLTRDIDGLRDPDRALEFALRDVDVTRAKRGRADLRSLVTLALAQHLSGDTTGAIATQKRAIARLSPRASKAVRTAYEANLRTYEAALREHGDQPDG
jgi:serine/threonine protein kinase/tetratricopeptide (TPR) repeat protein